MSKQRLEELKEESITGSKELLTKASLLNFFNKWLVEAHTKPVELYKALSLFDKAGILTNENFNLVADPSNAEKLLLALSILMRQSISTPENLKKIAEHSNPENLFSAIDVLSFSQILNQKNLDFVAKHDNPYQLASALNSLKIEILLNEKNLKLFDNHNGKDIAAIIDNLHKAKLLNQGNLEKVSKCTDLHNLAGSVGFLKDKTENQRKLEDLIRHHSNPIPVLVKSSEEPQKSKTSGFQGLKDKFMGFIKGSPKDNQTSSKSKDSEHECSEIEDGDYLLVDKKDNGGPKP